PLPALDPEHHAVELGASPLPFRGAAQGCRLAQSDRGVLEDPRPAGVGRLGVPQRRRCGPRAPRWSGRLEPESHALPVGTASQARASPQARLRLPYLRNNALPASVISDTPSDTPCVAW